MGEVVIDLWDRKFGLDADRNLVVPALIHRTSATPAAAGSLISDATALTAEFNAVTAADGTKGVKLPIAEAGKTITVLNTNASNVLKVWPVSGSQINALGASNAFSLSAGQTATFTGRSATLWYTAAATDTIAGLTASAAELNFNDGSLAGTSVASKTLVLGTNKNTDILVIADGGFALGSGAGTVVGATAAELNNAADVSARTQELTVSGAVTAGKQSVELNHATVIVAATITNANAHQGLFVVKDTSATGTAAHTLTLTAGTFDGTNTVATFNARDDCLAVYFDSTGRGTVLVNVGAVSLS